MECIVLAGGLGTRLRGVIGEMPKCMAPVNDEPFLHYLFDYLEQQNCTRVILSLGYRHEVILEWLKTTSLPFPVDYVIEEEPLGTGGGIQLALEKAMHEDVAVLNGDTLFIADLAKMYAFHREKQSETTLLLKEMFDFDRYGVVVTDGAHHITAFEEKKPRAEGWINGGIYMINRAAFLGRGFGERFSFEKDYLERYVHEGHFFACNSSGYFIDIGIPRDYDQAQLDFKALFT